jgi:hypothetical protein
MLSYTYQKPKKGLRELIGDGYLDNGIYTLNLRMNSLTPTNSMFNKNEELT